jgi:GIY-YIG catalytic domain
MDISIPERHLAYGGIREDHCLVPPHDYQFCTDLSHQFSENQIISPMPIYSTYILRCADDTLYTGITTDTARRVIEHNQDDKK